MPRDDLDVVDRVRRALDERTFAVPASEIARAGRRRRRDGLALATVVVLVVATLVATGVTRGAGVTVAGFAVQDVDGKSAIVFLEPSGSMRPTIAIGQVVAVDIEAYTNATPSRGDIVAFALDDPSCDLVLLKRVVALPGDTVEERDGILYVNGDALDRPRERRDVTLGPWTVEPGHLFLVGDNLADSADSRFWSDQIPIEDVIGRVDLSLDVSGANVEAPPACVAPATST